MWESVSVIFIRILHTLERAEIIRDMRLDVFDVLVGINLLREGLDIPEITLVAILDAEAREGFPFVLQTSLIQTIGRCCPKQRRTRCHVCRRDDGFHEKCH